MKIIVTKYLALQSYCSWTVKMWSVLMCSVLFSQVTVAWQWHVESGPGMPGHSQEDKRYNRQHMDKRQHRQHQHLANNRHLQRQGNDRFQNDQPYQPDNIYFNRDNNDVSHNSGTPVPPLNPVQEALSPNRGVDRREVVKNENNQFSRNDSNRQVGNAKNNNDLSSKQQQKDIEEERDGDDNVSESVVIKNTLNRPPESMPNDPNVLQNLVYTLQEQLLEAKSSQVHTRSILNVIQEKQEAQERDLQKLKDTILDLRNDQQKDRGDIEDLQKIAEDNAWGVSNLKTSADQIRKDFTAFKELQLSHNETMLGLESLAMNNEMDHDTFEGSIKHLQKDMLHIKTQIEVDRASLNQLSSQFELATRIGPLNKDPDDDGPLDVANRIPAVPSDDHGGFEGSGDKSGELNSEFDKLASSIEEKHNVIGHRIQRLLAKEKQMEQDMVRTQKRFVLYDGEFSKLFTMFYNLSLQISAIENKLLTNQQGQFEADLRNLQQGFLNFTQQVFHLQQWHSNEPGNASHPVQNQEGVGHFGGMIDSHSNQIQDIEQSILNTKAANQQNHILMNNQIAKLNDSIRSMRKVLMGHNVKASDIFDDVSDKMVDMNTRIEHNDDRLTRVEVKVLNATLESCQKANTDLTQDNFLNTLDKGLSKVDRRTGELSDKLSKIERGVANLYDVADTQGNTMAKIISRVQDVMHQLPQIKKLQKEVRNFIMQLPADCAAIKTKHPASEDGSYLIHPSDSQGSALVACQFEGDDTWTVIQKRDSGYLSFAKTWDEYKYGFGNPQKEYWIGNENLHYLTSQNDYKLHISMWDLNGQYWWAEYDHFQVDDLEESYALHIDGYSGNATDAMRYSNYMPFSTLDNDNDVSSTHCAKFYTAGWWYKHCQYANLNGRYTVGIVWFNHDVDEWIQMQKTVMKIRPRRLDEKHYKWDNSTEEKKNAT